MRCVVVGGAFNCRLDLSAGEVMRYTAISVHCSEKFLGERCAVNIGEYL